jgi:hypothetical protein
LQPGREYVAGSGGHGLAGIAHREPSEGARSAVDRHSEVGDRIIGTDPAASGRQPGAHISNRVGLKRNAQIEGLSTSTNLTVTS